MSEWSSQLALNQIFLFFFFRWWLAGSCPVIDSSDSIRRSARPRSDHPAIRRVSPAHQGEKTAPQKALMAALRRARCMLRMFTHALCYVTIYYTAPFSRTGALWTFIRLIPLSLVPLGCPPETVRHVESELSCSTTGCSQPCQTQEHHRCPRMPGWETGRYACTVTLAAFLIRVILPGALHRLHTRSLL